MTWVYRVSPDIRPATFNFANADTEFEDFTKVKLEANP